MGFEESDSYGNGGITMTPDGATPDAVVIWMHGLGDDAYGWFSSMAELKELGGVLATAKYILPTAVKRPIALNGGFWMTGWSDIKSLDPGSAEDLQGFEESRQRIEKIIKGEIDKGVKPKRIIVGGFSQGGALALHVATRSNVKLGGAVALSSWLPVAKDAPSNLGSAATQIPVLMCHGTADTIVQHQWGKMSFEKLKEMGFDATFHEYPGMAHSACPKEISDLAAFLKAKLA